MHTVFQPIVHLASGSIAGFEALSRGPAGTQYESPLALIQAAEKAGRLGELDWLCRSRAMHAAAEAQLPETLSWLINVEPAGLAMDCPPHLLVMQERARLDLRVILEIVERDVQGNVLDLIRATDDARFGSWGVALDDVGVQEASLALLPFLRPDVVKLDMSLIQGAPHEATASITAAVRAYAEQRGAVILAEGVETHAHEQLAKVFGATYGQGYYYGRPGPLPVSVAVPAAPIPLRQYVAPLDGRTPFEVLSTTIEPQRAEKQNLIHISAHLENRAAHGTEASVLLAGFQDQAFFTEAKQARYRQLSASNALTVVLADGLTRKDEPAYYIRALPPGTALGKEWVVIVLSPHFAGALVARDCGDTGSSAQRRFDFIYTHDRDAVINAARSFIQDLASEPSQRAARLRAPSETMPDRLAYQRRVPAASRGWRDATTSRSEPLVVPSTAEPSSLDVLVSTRTAESYGFRATAQAVLDYLNAHLPMAFWSITRVENEQQTYLYLDGNDYGLTAGGSHPWRDSYCVHMVAGTAPRIAPDAAAIPLYAAAAVNQAVQIGAYAGAPIAEPDGTLFGAICGLDRVSRDDIAHYGPILDLLSELLSISLASDRALHHARAESNAALTYATTDSLTGIHNRHAWDTKIAQLDLDFATYADPTVIVIVDLDNLKHVNDGPGGHSAGDQLLRDAAQVMRRYKRDEDFLARLGGDEFGIILTNTPADLAPALGHRMTRELDRAGIPASVGWSPLLPDGTVQTAVKLADEAMYQAKRHRKSKG
ncbi:EAL domain-containing protein [uncultured Jatrophihabitans sp.]|uniref:EAL domain-containing protein n=1 Tax=uncultured Jatrophihabitans sp. TaxID=1610747 RepID=UPI0035CB8A6A